MCGSVKTKRYFVVYRRKPAKRGFLPNAWVTEPYPTDNSIGTVHLGGKYLKAKGYQIRIVTVHLPF